MANKAKQSLALNTPLTPDFDLILDKVTNEITNSGDANQPWTDIVTGATGSFITRTVASVAADGMFAVERGQHEAFPQIARRPSSIYAGAQMLGVHIQRKIPSTITARIARDSEFSTKSIPAYSSWTCEGIPFFNRNPIYFAQDVKFLTVNLHRGEFATETFISDGQARQSFIFGPGGFNVSDVDVLCYVIDPVSNTSTPVQYKVVTEGLWEYDATTRVTQVITTIDGKCRLEFGNGVSGYIPPAGHQIQVQYVKVQEGQSLSAVDLINLLPIDSQLFCLTDNQVAGLSKGTLSPVTAERAPSFYSRNAPFIRSGKKFGNTRDNMRALALEFPGVIDCVLRGQTETNPSDPRYMNAIETTLLTTGVWSESQRNQFIQFMHSKSCSSRHFYFRQTEAIVLNFNIRLLIADRAQKDNVEQRATTILNEFFTLDDEALAKRFSEADLTTRFKNEITDPYGKLITYAKVNSPEDVQALDHQYFVKGTVNFDTKYDPKDGFRIVQGTAVPGDRIGITG